MTFFGNIKVFEHDVLFHRLPYLRAERNPLEIYSGRRLSLVRSCRHYFQIAALPDLRRTGRGRRRRISEKGQKRQGNCDRTPVYVRNASKRGQNLLSSAIGGSIRARKAAVWSAETVRAPSSRRLDAERLGNGGDL